MGQFADNNDSDVSLRDTTRYKTQGYRRSGPADFGRGNASACVAACFDEFIPNVEDACRQLQQPGYQQSRLWDLYCCDSLNCGVYIGTVGQSRKLAMEPKLRRKKTFLTAVIANVDLIINKCQKFVIVLTTL